MLIQEAALADLISHHLVEGGGMQIGSLFGHDQFANHLWRRDDPGQADARCQQFREGAQIDDIASISPAIGTAHLAIKLYYGGNVFAFVTKLSIWIIFYNGNAVFVSQFHQFLAAFQAKRRAGRVLEIGQDIDKFRTHAQGLLQFIHDHAVFI